SAWSGSPSRSATNPTTRSRSHSVSGLLAGDTSSRRTSRPGSRTASGCCSPAWSGSVRSTRRRGASQRRAGPVVTAVAERPVGFGRREDGGAAATATVPGAVTLDDAAAAALLPERPKRGHKGSFGKVLVIAGSLDYAGAALLVCRAAGRAGAGLVTLAVPESLQPLFAMKVVEATTMALPEDDVEEVDPEPSIARILDHEHD